MKYCPNAVLMLRSFVTNVMRLNSTFGNKVHFIFFSDYGDDDEVAADSHDIIM